MPLQWSVWKKIEVPCPHEEPAVYKIICVQEIDPPRPINIPRFLKPDCEGILCIGETANMKQRRRDFYNGTHVSGELLRKILKKYTNLSTVYADAFFVYSYCLAASKAEAEKLEAQRIKEYVLAHGEVPPLNSVIPDRHNHQEWQAIHAALMGI